jgi:hypothetical protein
MNKLKDKVKQLTIKEDEWGRGTLYYEGKYCALGFLCRAVGLDDKEIGSRSIPSRIERCPDWLRTLLKSKHGADNFQGAVITVNDDEYLPIDQKKTRLKTIFKEMGIDLHFKGGTKQSQGASK